MIDVISITHITFLTQKKSPVSEAIAVAMLTEREQRQLVARHPELREGESAVVISAPRALLPAIEQLAERLAWESTRQERLLDALLQDVDSRVLGEARVVQLQRQARAREEFLAAVDTLTSAEIAEINGSRARNVSALANRWKAGGRIFSVGAGRVDRFPAFQFGDDGRPLPVVADVIRAFAGHGEWAIALWFTAPSGWLGGRTPASVLRTDPASVLDAARNAVEPLDV